VLANEGVLQPGRYSASFRIFGPGGLVWDRQSTVAITSDNPLAVTVLKETITLDGPAGIYTLAAELKGAAAKGDRLIFHLSREDEQPRISACITTWGIDTSPDAWMYPVESFSRIEGPEISVGNWLATHGVECRPFDESASADEAETILVGFPEPVNPAHWQECLRRVERGATAVFLVPQAWKKEEDTTHWLPLTPKGECIQFYDWLYHKECVGKNHTVFSDLPSGGLLPWQYYDQVIPHNVFIGLPDPEETIAAAFATGYPRPGGYLGGVLIGSYRHGAGRLILNTMRILEHVNRHPAADRLLLNLVRHATVGTVNGS
jgi:hypothetical protein